MGFGISSQTTTVSSVSDCVISQAAASAGKSTCAKADPPSPAKKAGLRAGDRITAFDGHPITDWNTLQTDIRRTTGPATVTVERGGRSVVLHADLIRNQVAKTDGHGGYVDGKFVTAGFLGFTPAEGIVRLGFSDSLGRMGDLVSTTTSSLVDLPERIPALWRSAFDGAPRQPDSPMGVVGAARVGGDVFSLHIPPEQRVATMLTLVAGFNLSLFLFNMLPLLPLDGGHIAGALWEALKRNLARAFRRPDPGPFDVAKMMPVAYVVAGIFLSFTVLVLIADVVNPVKIT
jgi:membrane-associated protease RseP (regulator of RpoE activity)